MRRQRVNPYRQQAALRDTKTADTGRKRVPGGPMSVHRVPTGVDLLALDHVGLSVADPDAVAAFLCDHVGMHELTRTPDLVVVGAGARAAPLALIAAQGPREPGTLARLVLRVSDVERAVAALPGATAVEGDGFELAAFEGPEGLGLGFTMVAGGGIDYDLDHVVLRVSDPEQIRVDLAAAGWVPRGQALQVADKYIALETSPAPAERPLLDHIAVRVDSVAAVAAQARERDLQADEAQAGQEAFDIVLAGLEQIRLRFVEQAPPDQP